MPVGGPKIGNDVDPSKHKTASRVAYLRIEDYVAHFVGGQSYDATDEAYVGLWQSGVRVAVSLDRATHASQIYYVGFVAFSKQTGRDGGSYALIQHSSTDSRALFEEALRALETYGIGGERSSGYGAFSATLTLAAREWADRVARDGEPGTLLSTWFPGESDDIAQIARVGRYRLAESAGWIGTTEAPSLRRRVVCGLRHGSIVPRLGIGRVVDCAPAGYPHPVVRCGTTVALKIDPSFLRRPGGQAQ
jgi:CRISPR-associated protein Csm4